MIVLLILAGVTIATLTGDNGLLTKAGEAKSASEIAGEKETAELAVIKATSENNYGKLEEQNLKNALEEGTTVEKKGKIFLVTLKNGNQYRIYSNGKTEYYDFKPMETSTPVYGKLDNDGTLYLRATNPEGYRNYTNSSSITSEWNTTLPASKEAVLKVVIEEPIAPTNTNSMFSLLTNLTTIENIKNLHTEYVTDMAGMFNRCYKLKSLDIGNFNTSSATNMNQMFHLCYDLEKLDLSWFDTSNAEREYGKNVSWMLKN